VAHLCVFNWVGEEDPRSKVPALVGLLEHPDPQVRYLAGYYLTVRSSQDREVKGAYAGADLMETIQRATRDPVPEVAVHALYLLGNFKDARNVDFLLARLAEVRSSEPMCRAAVCALWDIGDPRALDAVLPLTRDPRIEVRWRAIHSLGDYDDARAEDQIRECLISSDPEDAESAMSAIRSWSCRRNFRDPRFDDPLILAAARSDLSPEIRFRFLDHGILDPSIELKALLAIARSPSADDSWTREGCWREALEKLAHLDPAVRPALLEVAERDPDDVIRLAALEALEEIRKRVEEEAAREKTRPRKKARRSGNP
jgi:HEAT repeat protein